MDSYAQKITLMGEGGKGRLKKMYESNLYCKLYTIPIKSNLF